MLARRYAAIIALGLLVLMTAIAIVLGQHHSRSLVSELQALHVERDKLDVEWGQLLLEQSTWATPSRVEGVAGGRLGMQVPEQDSYVVISR